MITSWSKKYGKKQSDAKLLGEEGEGKQKKRISRARSEGRTCWKAMEMMWKVVSVSSCYCVMLCSLAFPILVTVVSFCESEFVCHPCEPQRFISQNEQHYCSENSTPTSCDDNSTPTLPREVVTMWEDILSL